MTKRSDNTTIQSGAGGPDEVRRPFASRPAGLWTASLLTALAVFLLDFATACRTVGPGDSGELAAAMCSWGVVHAPGYPLLSLLGNLVSLLPFPGEPAFALNLMTSLFGALACGALVVAVAALTDIVAAGVLAGLALGTSRVFWEYSLVVEVFSLNALAGALLLALMALFLRSLAGRRPAFWTWPASAWVMSATITHHMTLVLVAIPVLLVYGVVALRPKAWGVAPAAVRAPILRSIVVGAIGLLPLLYLPLAASHNPTLEWGEASTWLGFRRQLLRSDFGSGTLMSPWAVADTILQNGAAVAPGRLHHLLRFWMEIPRNFGWLVPPLALIGLVSLVRRHRLFGLFAAGWLAMLVAFFLRVNSPLLPLYLGVTERFYILPSVVLAMLAGGGAAGLVAWLARRRAALTWPLAAGLIALSAGAMAFVNAPKVSMRHNTFTRDLGANLLAGLPPNALVLSEGDLYHNAIYYQLLALRQRPDVDLVDQQKLTYTWYVSQLRARGRVRLPAGMTSYGADPATHCRTWLDLNQTTADGRPRSVVAVSLRDGSYSEAYHLLPGGLWWRIQPNDRPVPIARQAAMIDSVARLWRLETAGLEHHDRSWETNSRGIYVRGLSMVAGVLELADELAAGNSGGHLRAAAAGWRARAEAITMTGATGRRGASSRAAARAAEAEAWQVILSTEPPEWESHPSPDRVAEKAIQLAEEAVALDGTDPVALERLVSLGPAVPAQWSTTREIELRGRWLDAKPGVPAIAAPYLQKVLDEVNLRKTAEPSLLEPAVNRVHRLVELVELGHAYSREAWFDQTVTQWRGYEIQLRGMLNGLR